MAEPAPTSELSIPKPVGTVIGASVMTAFLLFFFCLAIYNLIGLVAVIPSTLWLLLVIGVVFGRGKQVGTRQFLITVLGAFASKEFAWIIRREDAQNEMQLGYRFFGHRFFYLKIPVDKIVKVYWSTGQASHRAGCDMKDWSVAVWYEHGDPIRQQKQHNEKNPGQDIHIVGPPGKKDNTAAFGQAFLDFLRQSGASLVEGGNDCSFERQPVTL